MSDTIWTPLRPDVSGPGGTPKWCDGTAFFYPTEPGKMPDGSLKAKPLRLVPYNQIIQVRNAIVPTSPRDEWLADAPLTAAEIQAFKEDIEEWQHAFEADWEIPIGDEEYFHKHDINELRRLATYPNIKTHYDLRGVYPLLHDWCYDYATDGMQVLMETTGNCDGWQGYLNSLIAPPDTSHRFWLWTQYLEMGVWHGTSAGIIGLDGRMKAPIGGYSSGGWHEGPESGGDTENFWLILLRQDVHKPVEELSTAIKALKGRIRWLGYTVSTHWHLHLEIHDEPDPDFVINTYTVTNTCKGTTEITVDGPRYPTYFEFGLCAGYGNTCDRDFFYTDTYPAEDEDYLIGDDFFQTWEHYMDQL
jgi:hypothetical protein